jgi:hypothetical protein
MPQVIEIPGHGDVEFPDSMDQAAVLAAVRKLAGPAQAPPATPEQLEQAKAQPTMTVGKAPGLWQRISDSIKSGSAPRVFAHGAGMGLPESAAAGIDALANPERSKKTFSQRYREGKDTLDAETQKARDETPAAGAVELAGAVASPLNKVLGPLSKLAKAKGLGLGARMGVGAGEAALTSGAQGAATNLDRPAEAAHEAMNSPWNLLGTAGPAFEKAVPAVGRWLRDRAQHRALRSLKPSSEGVGDLYQTFGELFGSGAPSPAAAEWLRDAKLQDGTFLIKRGDTPELIHRKLKQYMEESGEAKRQITELAHKAGAAVDTDSMMKKIGNVAREFITPEAIAADPGAADKVAVAIGRIQHLAEQGYRGQGHVAVPGTHVNGAAVQGPARIPTAYNPRMTDLNRWEKLKTKLQTAAEDAFANEKSTPVKQALAKISSIIKNADEEAVGNALGPEGAEQFVKLKDQYKNASAFEPVAKHARDNAVSESARAGSGLKRWAFPAAVVAGAGSSYAFHHNPAVAVGTAAAGMTADAWAHANPAATRGYDRLGRYLQDKKPEIDPETIAAIQYLRGGTK